MREVIQQVMAAEAAAKQQLEAARADAEQLLENARGQARELVENARREARVEVEKTLAAAEETARREKTERVARAAREIEGLIRVDDATVRNAVEAAVRCVCGLA